MANETPTPTEATVTAAKSGSMKTMLIVAAVLALEAGTIIGTMYLSGSPSAAQGQTAEQIAQAEQNKLVEMEVVKKKFFSQQGGRAYYYDTEIYITARVKHEKKVADQIAASQAALTEQIDTLFRQGDRSMFLEPSRLILKRKLKAIFDERFGNDEQDLPIIEQVLIKQCIPFPAEI